jgi:hypothetical protein
MSSQALKLLGFIRAVTFSSSTTDSLLTLHGTSDGSTLEYLSVHGIR